VRSRGRILTALLIITGLTWATPAPGGDPEVPERYIKVDEVKALQDSKKRLTIIDVRDKDQYDELHIKGARNVPLREMLTRLAEVPRQEPVVLY
jgi:3-mercaptopyruvate sulfurtransferase SseA